MGYGPAPKAAKFSAPDELRYAPDQPRDHIGRWTSGGGPGAATQTALNADPHVANDAGGLAQPAQMRPPRGAEPAPTTARQQNRLEAARAAESSALARVREVDPRWKPEPSLTAPRNIEGEIARSENIARQANERANFVEGAQKGLPAGMPSREEFAAYGTKLRDGLRAAGYDDADVALRGSAVTGESFRTGEPFDVGRTSDYDVAVISQKGIERSQEFGLELRGGGSRTEPIKPKSLDGFGLDGLYDSLLSIYGRKTNFMFYASPRSVMDRGEYLIVP